MNFTLRFIKIAMVAVIALFFSLVGYNNIIDYHSNWLFVQHVLSMDTTFRAPMLLPRAISNPTTQAWAYHGIIAWEIFTALLCWLGALALLCKIKKPAAYFNAGKTLALLGLFCGFLLYMLGFIVIGGEWFTMWQSSSWNGQMKAGLFVSMIMFVLIFLQMEDKDINTREEV